MSIDRIFGPSLYPPRKRSSLGDVISIISSPSSTSPFSSPSYDERQSQISSSSLLLGLRNSLLGDILSGYLSLFELIRLRGLCKKLELLIDNELVKNCVGRCGVLEIERPRFWLYYCANIEALQESHKSFISKDSAIVAAVTSATSLHRQREDIYKYWLSQDIDPLVEGEISRDVGRTMPTHPFFLVGGDGQQKLTDVLRAVVASEKSVGYCQGMNFIAAVFLIHLNASECDSFWMMLALLEHYHYKYLFAPEVPLLPLRVFQFSRVIRKEIPGLWHHLNSNSFSVDVIAHQWIMTLFSYYIDPQFLGNVWDLFFLTGWKALFKTGATILHSLEGSLLPLDIEKISEFFQISKRKTIHDDPFIRGTRIAMWKILTQFKIRNRDLYESSRQFQTIRLMNVIESVAISYTLIDSNRNSNHTGNLDEESEKNKEASFKDTLIHKKGFFIRQYLETSEVFLCIDLDSLETYNYPLEGLEEVRKNPYRKLNNKSTQHDKSIFHLSEKVHCDDGNRLISIPLKTVHEIHSTLKFASDSTHNDIVLLRQKIEGLERRVFDVQKRRDELIVDYESIAIEYAELSDRKRSIQDHIRGLMKAEKYSEDSLPASEYSQRASKFPLFRKKSYSFGSSSIRGGGSRSSYTSSVSRYSVVGTDDISTSMKKMSLLENDYFDKKLECERVKKLLEATDAELNDFLDIKTLYVKQFASILTSLEDRNNEIVWRTLSSAAGTFSKKLQNT